MALQTSGQISMTDIVGEFGGTAPHAVSEYYGEGGLPTSGQISWSDFYGESAAAAQFTVGIYYAGYETTTVNTVTRLNSSATLVGSETSIGTAVTLNSASYVTSNTVWYGGQYNSTVYNNTTRINSSGTQNGSTTYLGAGLFGASSATIGTLSVVWAGATVNNSNQTPYNGQLRISETGTLNSTQTAAGTPRHRAGGCSIEGVAKGFYYSGNTNTWNSMSMTNKLTQINTSGTLATAETTYGFSGMHTGSAAPGGTAQEGTTPTFIFASPDAVYGADVQARFNTSGTGLSYSTSWSGSTHKGTAGARVGSVGVYFGVPSGYFSASTYWVVNSSGTATSTGTASGTTDRSFHRGCGA